MRPRIGIVQEFDTPGMLSASFISATSCSSEMWSEVMCRSTGRIHSGAQDEYQTWPLPPFRLRLQDHDRLQHGERRRVGCRICPSGLAEDVIHFRESLQNAVGD